MNDETLKESKSAKYQRSFRERMKQHGFVQRAVYILPEYTGLLSRIEKTMQAPRAQFQIRYMEEEGKMNQQSNTVWNTNSLFDALRATELVETGRAAVELIDGIDPAINLTMHEQGELPVQIAISGEQIFMSSPLWEDSQVKNKAVFNELALLTNPINPLSNLGLVRLGDGRSLYIMFGELSSRSLLSHILEEIDVLVNNTIQAADDFSEHLVN